MFPDDIERAIALLPWWTGWVGPSFWLVMGAALGFLLAYGSALAVQPKLTGKEAWHERARLMHPANIAAMNVSWISAGVVAASFSQDLVANLELWPIGGVSCLLGGFAACAVVGRQATGRRDSWISYPKSLVALFLILIPMWFVSIVMSFMDPGRSPLRAVVIGGLGFLAYELVRRGGTVVIARLLGLAKSADAKLEANVLEQAARAEVDVSGVCVMEMNQANALVFPKSKLIIFTKGAVESLSESELTALSRHELGHCNEPISVQRLRWVRGAMPVVLGLSAAFGALSWIVALGSLIAYFVLGARLKNMEHRADEQANEEGSADYANALLGLHRHNGTPAVLGTKTNTHPELYDRMLACGVTPEFPRPDPPKKTGWIPILLAPLMAIVGTGLLAGMVVGIAPAVIPDSVPIALAVLPVEDTERELHDRGLDAFDAGDYETSAAWLSLLLELEPDTKDGPLHLASSFCALERCEDIAKLNKEHELGPFACIACDASGTEVLELEEFASAENSE